MNTSTTTILSATTFLETSGRLRRSMPHLAGTGARALRVGLLVLGALLVTNAPLLSATVTFTQSFGAASIPLNGTTSLTFTVSAGTVVAGESFVDTLPSGLIVATPNGLSAVTGGCSGETITATAGASSISMSGANIPGGASCLFSVNVTGTTAGVKNNSTEETVDSTTATASLTVFTFGHVQLGAVTGVTQTIPIAAIFGPTLGSPAVKAFTVGTEDLDFTVVSGAGTTCVAGITDAPCTVEIQFLPTAPGLRRGAVVLYDNQTPANPVATVPLWGFADAPVAALSPSTASVINLEGLSVGDPFQVALDGSGNMYVATGPGDRVLEVPAGGGFGGSLVNTGSETLGLVSGVALDGAGNVFIADYSNSRIVVVPPGGTASVLSISGLTLNQPGELNFDSAGNLYIADEGNGRIVEVTSLAVAGSTSTGVGSVFGTGSFTFAGSQIKGVAVDQAGTVYITDNFGPQIDEVTAAGVGSVLATGSLTLTDPQGVSVDAMGNVYIADFGNSRIVEVTTAGVASVVSTPGLPVAAPNLNFPLGVAVDPSGNIFILDSNNARIVEVPVAGASLAFESTNAGSTSADSPMTATVTNLGNLALNLSALPTYTSNFSENLSDGNLCTASTSLLAGTGCDVSVNFTPQSGGSLGASILVADNALNNTSSTQVVTTSGTGVALATMTALQSSPAGSSVFGQSVTFTATVTSSSTPVTTGTVTFTDTTTSATLGSAVPLNGSGQASVSVSTLAVGSGQSIQATYNPDVTHSGSLGTESFTVSKANTTTGVTSSANPTVFGQSVTFTATISVSAPGAGTPSGTVTFLDGGLTIGMGTLSGGVATVTTSALAPGNHTITTTYTGDTNFSGSLGALTGNPQVVNKASTTTGVTSSANPTVFGQSVTFRATLSANAPGSGTPTGIVTFLDGGGSIGSGTLSGGVATLSTSSLAVGTHTITTTYLGDGNFTGSGGSLTGNPQSVNKASSSTGLTSSANPSVFGQPVTFTATLSANAPGAGTPTGIVTFLDGGLSIGSGTLSGGVATLTTSTLAIASHTITTTYTGDGNFTGSAGSLTGNPQVVTKANSTTVVTSSLNPTVFGQSVTFTATLSATAPGAGTPTGSVTFLDGGISIGSGTLSSGVATLTTSALAAGNHTMTTNYTGDASFNGSTGALTGTTQVVNKANSTAVVTSVSNPSVYGGSVTFTVALTVVAPGVGIPTGMVTFLDGGSPIGTVTLSVGAATFSTSALAAGLHTITTSYSGDASFNTGTGSLGSNPQLVNKATLAITASSTSMTYGGTPPAVTASYSAFAGTDTVASLTTPPTCASAATNSTPVGGGTGANTCSGAVDPNYNFVYVPGNVTVGMAALTITASSTTMIYGAAPPAVTPLYSAFAGTDTAASLATAPICVTTATKSTLAGTDTGANTCSGAVDGNYTFSYLPGNVTVGKATPTVALMTSLGTVLSTNPITLTATVSSPASTPTGSVSFYDGTTLLGSAVTLTAGGIATYTTSSLAIATHSLTAVYSGDSNFVTVTSSPSSENVIDFTLNIPSGGLGSVTTVAGGTAAYTFTVSPPSGGTFPSAVVLTISGLPSGATATITPSTIPAGSGAMNVNVIVYLSGSALVVPVAPLGPGTGGGMQKAEGGWQKAVRNVPVAPLGPGLALALMGGMLLVALTFRSAYADLKVGATFARRPSGRPGRFAVLLLLGAAACILLGITGCGGGGTTNTVVQSQTYTLTITATSGNLSHSTTATLVVD